MPPPPIRPRLIELPGRLLSPEPPLSIPPRPDASPVDGAAPIVAAPGGIPPP